METLLRWDHQLFLAINNGWQSALLDFMMPLFTLMGDIWYMAFIITPLLYFMDKNNFRKNMTLFVAILFFSGMFGQMIKHLVGRPRPLKEMSELISSHRVYIHVIGVELRELSFPSGHATTAFSIATFLSLLRRRWAVLFFFLAVLTGVSRIYMGAHFPLDVLGGLALGVVVTLSVYLLMMRSFFRSGITKPLILK